MRPLKGPGCAVALPIVVLAIGGFWAFRWWRAPGHGELVVVSGSLTQPYVLEGHVSLGVTRDHPDCTAFKVQNPMPAHDSVTGHFQRLGQDRYRMTLDLREAPLGGFCGWRITQLAVQVLPPKDPFLYASSWPACARM